VAPAVIDPQPVLQEQPSTAPVLKRNVRALQPVHIKEALRRLSQPETSVAPLWVCKV